MENKNVNELRRKQLIGLMGKGVENIKEAEYFMKIMNIPRRTLTDIIEELRKDYPIVSRKVKPCGYFVAIREEEIKDYIIDLQSSINGLQNNVTNMQNHLIEGNYNVH